MLRAMVLVLPPISRLWFLSGDKENREERSEWGFILFPWWLVLASSRLYHKGCTLWNHPVSFFFFSLYSVRSMEKGLQVYVEFCISSVQRSHTLPNPRLTSTKMLTILTKFFAQFSSNICLW